MAFSASTPPARWPLQPRPLWGGGAGVKQNSCSPNPQPRTWPAMPHPRTCSKKARAIFGHTLVAREIFFSVDVSPA